MGSPNKITKLVEQKMVVTLKLAQYVYIFELGTTVMKGPTSELLHNERIRKACLSYEL